MAEPGVIDTPSELNFLQLAEHFNEVFWVTSPDGMQVHYLSPAFERLWGRPVTEVYAAPFKWMQAVHPEDMPDVVDLVSRRKALGPVEAEYRIRAADGTWRYVRDRSVPIRDAEGKTIRIAALCEDVTAQKIASRKSEEALKSQRDALVREVHHRIKNNLQGVTGLLRNYAGEHPEVAAVINEAVAQVQAVAVIHGLHGQSDKAEVLLCDLLQRIVAGIGQLMQRDIDYPHPDACRSCHIVVAEQEAVPVALVLNELVFNAIKHGNPRSVPRIDLAIDLARESVLLTIANDGNMPDRRRRASSAGPDGSGLTLVRSLLPRRGAGFELASGAQGVEARLRLAPPVISLRC